MAGKSTGRIYIGEDLGETMRQLGFDESTCTLYQERFAGSEQPVLMRWKDGDEEYATIDLCVEIPMRCCKVIK